MNSQLLLAFLTAVALGTFICASAAGPASLEFYMNIIVQNNSDLYNPHPFTAVQSAQPARTYNNSFGIIHTFDNPLTSAPSLVHSTRLGRMQGWYGDVGQDVLTLFLVQTFTISTRRYSGTFSLLGVDIASDPIKYAPIVGGTGDFAYARGVAAQTLVSEIYVNNGQTVSWFHYHVDFKYS